MENVDIFYGNLIYFTNVWYIFGILIYFMSFWYTFPFGKNLANLAPWTGAFSRLFFAFSKFRKNFLSFIFFVIVIS
jgi:hypothetical protein